MASKQKRSTAKATPRPNPGPSKRPSPERVAGPRRRDVRPFIYTALDVGLAILLYVIITDAAPNRHAWAQGLMWCLPAGALLMALGTAAGAARNLAVRYRGRGAVGWLLASAFNFHRPRIWWTVAVAGGVLMLVVAVAVLALLLSSAAFLSGVYGAFGKAAATGMLVACALVIELVGVIPTLQLKYLMTRAGRRAFGLAPLWARA